MWNLTKQAMKGGLNENSVATINEQQLNFDLQAYRQIVMEQDRKIKRINNIVFVASTVVTILLLYGAIVVVKGSDDNA